MKKKILPDGSIELEGDPEELAEYEEGAQDHRKDEKVNKGKRLLNEEEIHRLIEDAIDRHETLKWHHPWQEYIWRYTPYGTSSGEVIHTELDMGYDNE